MQITGETRLDTILENHPGAIPVLARHGLHTLSCPSEFYAPLSDIAESRGIPLNKLIAALRENCE